MRFQRELFNISGAVEARTVYPQKPNPSISPARQGRRSRYPR